MTEKEMNFSDKYIRWFYEIGKDNISVAGGKGANLGEMYNSKFPVPPGFVIIADAFGVFISEIREKIKNIMLDIDFEDTGELEKRSDEIRKIIEEQEMPEEIKTEILESYHILGTEKIDEKGVSQDALNILRNSQEPIFVSVRSSATTEDLADASFAGQQQSFLNVKGDFDLIEFVKKCFSSLYTARAMYYRNKKGFEEGKALLAVVVQKMVDSEKSGVVFSKNPVNIKDEVVIEGVFGLGEGIVSGMIHPDNYVVSGKEPEDLKIENIIVSDKKIAVVRSGSGENKVVKLSPEKSKTQVLTNGEILEIANYALKLEKHYKKPQDIEFAIEQNKVYIVQSRPITTKGVDKKEELSGKVILDGLGASPGIGVGSIKIIKGMGDLSKIKKGDVLVTEMTNPDMVVSMQKCAAIITDEGGMTSHASIVSREMGIPAVVGTGDATKVLKDGMKVTVDGTNGKIYEGQVTEMKLVEVKEAVPTKTRLKLILDLPEFAERAAKSKIENVGLLRLEGIIASLGKHPLKYEKDRNLEDYTELLRKGIEKISKYFKTIWIRSSDLRSDEYSSLEGSPEKEENPMLGFHGVRFSLKHPEILEAELEAIRKVAEEYEDKEFGIMFPQIISIEEVMEVKKIFNKFKTKNMGFGVMIETPAAVQIIEDIAKEVDFISFGTNDLTQYTLAVDRGEESVQELYNESHPAVLSQIKKVLEVCRGKIETSICGQAGSNKKMVEFLLKNKINSISVNADAAYEISEFVRETENRLIEAEHKKEAEKGFDKRKQQGMVSKEEINEDVNQKTKEKKMAVCDECGKEFRLRFRPKKDLPIYCKACYKKQKKSKLPELKNNEKPIDMDYIKKRQKEFKEAIDEEKEYPKKEIKKEIGDISPIDNKEYIKDEIKGIQEEVKQENEEDLKEREEIEDSIETEINNEKIEEPVGDDFRLDSIGIYNPEETETQEKYNYAEDEEFSDVF